MSYLTNLKATHQLEINLIKDLVNFKSGMVFIIGNDQSLIVGCGNYLIKLDQSRNIGFIYEILIPLFFKLFKDLTRDNVKSYQMRVVGKSRNFKIDTIIPNTDDALMNANEKLITLKLTNYIYNLNDYKAYTLANILKPIDLNAVNHDDRYFIYNKYFKDINTKDFNNRYKVKSNEPKLYGNMFNIVNDIDGVQTVLSGFRKIDTMEVL